MRQLSAADRALLEADIQVESISAGTQLTVIGEPVDSIYFPVDTLISVEQSGGLEVAIVGREGMFGWSVLAGSQLWPFRAVTRGRGGQLLKIPHATVVAAFAASPALRAMLNQYLFVLAVQMSESMAAHGLHRLEARVARWILVRHDRVGGDEISAQHSEIAANLGARRASITDCLHIIEGHSEVRCRRGRILIRDRAKLEQRASGCYGLAEAQYRNSFGSFGKSLNLLLGHQTHG
jgi:CRP-like cAMP-binding protein